MSYGEVMTEEFENILNKYTNPDDLLFDLPTWDRKDLLKCKLLIDLALMDTNNE